MGDLEFHYQKVEEARNQGIEEGKKQAAEAQNNSSGDSSGIIWLILFLLAAYAITKMCENDTPAKPQPPQSAQVTYSAYTLPADISDYIGSDMTRFYKYTGNDGVVYIRHHYEPNDQLSKQGYFKSDTGEYILLTMNHTPQDGQWMCRWQIFYAVNGSKQALSSGSDIVSEAGISSQNCVDSLVQALMNYGYDSTVTETSGTEISAAEGRSFILG